jgi:hypothetical protein
MLPSLPRRQRSVAACVLAGAGVTLAASAYALLADHAAGPGRTADLAVSQAPPRPAGYFTTTPAGTWRTLPTDEQCAASVHHSTWEPRPDNTGPNNRMPSVRRVHGSFAARPLSGDGAFSRRWDTWVLPRVTGHYTGTTDEIFQWAACKWGISDNVLRAIAVRESTWFQYEVYPSGRCVTDWGCGDVVDTPTPSTDTFCTAISRYRHDYQADYAAGVCPKTFSIAGVMSWQDPDWGAMRDNQNGTFPFNRNSTAFALDYLGASLRGCYEGWSPWLDNAGPVPYEVGDLWGCVGNWYSGEWRTDVALGYVHRVRTELRHRTWLEADWAHEGPSCSPVYGCPRGS